MLVGNQFLPLPAIGIEVQTGGAFFHLTGFQLIGFYFQSIISLVP
jgi:hypothetical protein